MIILACLWYNQERLQKFPSQLVCLAYVTMNDKADIQGCPLTSSHVCSDIYANIYTGASIHTHITHIHATNTLITNGVTVSSSLVVFYIVEIQGSFYFCLIPSKLFLILCYSN